MTQRPESVQIGNNPENWMLSWMQAHAQYSPQVRNSIYEAETNALRSLVHDYAGYFSGLSPEQYITVENTGAAWSSAVNDPQPLKELNRKVFWSFIDSIGDRHARGYQDLRTGEGSHDAHALWAHTEATIRANALRDAVLGKFEEACLTGNVNRVHSLASNVPYDDAHISALAEKWFERAKTLSLRGEQAVRAGEIYRIVGSNDPRTNAERVIDGTPVVHLRASYLVSLQEHAEEIGDTATADTVEELGKGFFKPFVNNGKATYVSVRRGRAEAAAVTNLPSQPTPAEIALRKDRGGQRATRRGAAVAAAVTGFALISQHSAAAATSGIASPNLAAIDPASATHLPDFSSLFASTPATASETVGALDFSNILTSPDTKTTINDTATIADISMVTVVAPAKPIAAEPVQKSAEAPLTKAQKLKNIVKLFGQDAAAANAVDSADHTPVATPAPESPSSQTNKTETKATPSTIETIANSNKGLFGSLSLRLTQYQGALQTASMTPDQATNAGTYLAMLQASLINPSSLDGLDANTKKVILEGTGSGFEQILDHQSKVEDDAWNKPEYGAWKGYTADQKAIVTKMLAYVDLTLMSPEQVQALIDAQTPDPAPAAPAPESTPTPNPEQTPSNPNNTDQKTSEHVLGDALDKLQASGPDWQNRIIAIKVFMQHGYTLEQASGMVGNLVVESAGKQLDPTIKQFDGGPGRGIAQWGSRNPASDRFGYDTPHRQGTLQWYAQQTNGKWDTIETQIGFLIWELDNTEQGARNMVKAAQSPTDAAAAFMNGFERPKVRILGLRGTNAIETYNTINTQIASLTTTPDTAQQEQTVKGKFDTNYDIHYPGTDKMLETAHAVANEDSADFSRICDGSCYRMCDHLATAVWGWSNSGYKNANVHWADMVAKGIGHPNDRRPPVGAFLFYDTGSEAGHIVTYLGGNMILSNDISDTHKGQGTVSIVDASTMEGAKWNLHYLGWSDPQAIGGRY